MTVTPGRRRAYTGMKILRNLTLALSLLLPAVALAGSGAADSCCPCPWCPHCPMHRG